MNAKKNFSRRDFLKLGGLSAIALPMVNVVGKIGEDALLESEEKYGGFTIRSYSKDNPPYQVDDSIYQRFDTRNSIFSRMGWDTEFANRISNTETVYEKGDPGYTQLDLALVTGATVVGMHNKTYVTGVGLHQGLLDLELPYINPPQHPIFEEPWDHTQYSPEEISGFVKKAAKFYGASLVGIAQLDERWVYGRYLDVFFDMQEGEIEISRVEEVKLPDGQVSPREAGEKIKTILEKMDVDEVKDLVVDILENADLKDLPANAPNPTIIKLLPAKEVQKRISLFASMPASVLRLFAKKLELDFEIANASPGEAAKPKYLEDGTLSIPETMKSVIVLAFDMDYDMLGAAPTNRVDATTQKAYSDMAITAASLAVFIRSLGFNAIACGNNTALSVPQAIDAGLGEMGRNGILITPKYGPRVRLAKVITDMPLAYDVPIRFGVEEFCKVCKKCATFCPTKAISLDTEKSFDVPNISANPGVLKWTINAENCYSGWFANGSACSVCIQVCPFNKPEGWLHELTRTMISVDNGSLDTTLVKLDDASGYGEGKPKFTFWES